MRARLPLVTLTEPCDSTPAFPSEASVHGHHHKQQGGRNSRDTVYLNTLRNGDHRFCLPGVHLCVRNPVGSTAVGLSGGLGERHHSRSRYGLRTVGSKQCDARVHRNEGRRVDGPILFKNIAVFVPYRQL